MESVAEVLAAVQHRGMEVVSFAAGATLTQLLELGFESEQAASLRRLASIYFGSTSHTRIRSRAITAAEGSGATIRHLQDIEKFVGKLTDKGNSWKLREKLCGMTVTSRRTFTREATRILKSFNTPQEPARESGFRVRFHTRPGMQRARMTIDADAHLLTGFHRVASDYAKTKDTTVDEAVEQLLFKGREATAADFTTITVISLDAAVRVERGLGPDTRLTLTDGTVIWASDYVEKITAEHGLSMLVHPVEGEIDLFRTQRLANDKQRILAKAESPVCAWPGCYTPADRCEVNHNVPWVLGGHTNLSNLTVLCKYHNGIATHPDRWGRICKVNHTSLWFPPDGGTPIRNSHPAAQLGTWYWATQPG